MRLFLPSFGWLLAMLLFFNCVDFSRPEQAVVRVESTLTVASNRAPVMRSKDFGQTWESASGDLPTDVQASFLEPIGAKILLASDNRGLFLSNEDQSQWVSIGEGLPYEKINALHVVGERIYVGVYRAGIFRSDDFGKSWEALNYDLPDLHVQAIFQGSEHLFVGTDSGIFRLAPASEHWVLSSVLSQILSIYQRSGKMVAGSSQGTLISKDQGMSWDWIHQAGAVHYTHPIRDRMVELLLNGDVIYSDDWGQSWSMVDYQPREDSYVYEIVQVGSVQLISNNYGIHRSADQGQTWNLVYPTEEMAFFDLLPLGTVVYGGTRAWDEYRKRQ
ncbi:MAG: hypothetical protein AAGH79_16565 [Bacteroidota bacterium]